MSNEKSRGVDGKQHRKPIVKTGDKPEEGGYGDGFLPQADADQVLSVLQCARGDELNQAGLQVTYGNCVGNLFSTEDPICLQCGVCKRVGRMYNRVGFSHLAMLSLDRSVPSATHI